MPTWGTLIALQDRGKGIMGMLDQPFLRERFVGHGEGAYEGERRLAVLIGARVRCRSAR